MDKLNTWQEVKESTNTLFTKITGKDVDFVCSVCNNALPHAMTQVMAMALSRGMTKDNDYDVKVVVNGYLQLEFNGFIEK